MKEFSTSSNYLPSDEELGAAYDQKVKELIDLGASENSLGGGKLEGYVHFDEERVGTLVIISEGEESSIPSVDIRSPRFSYGFDEYRNKYGWSPFFEEHLTPQEINQLYDELPETQRVEAFRVRPLADPATQEYYWDNYAKRFRYEVEAFDPQTGLSVRAIDTVDDETHADQIADFLNRERSVIVTRGGYDLTPERMVRLLETLDRITVAVKNGEFVHDTLPRGLLTLRR